MVGQQKETRLVNEWLEMQDLDLRPWKKARVGPLPKGPFARLYKVAQRYVDAIFIKDGVVYLLEAKLKPTTSEAGKLEYANEVFDQTPDFKAIAHLPRRMIFLTTRDDPLIREFYERKGIQYVVYCPEWIKEVLEHEVRNK